MNKKCIQIRELTFSLFDKAYIKIESLIVNDILALITKSLDFIYFDSLPL